MGIAAYGIDFLYTHLLTYSNARSTFVDLVVNMSRSSQGRDLHLHCSTLVNIAACQVSMKSVRRFPRKRFYRGFTIYTFGNGGHLGNNTCILSTHKIQLRCANSFIKKNHAKAFFHLKNILH